ncbi:O-antigen ligase family protein [Deltaproteobacteria bacterium TL4]
MMMEGHVSKIIFKNIIFSILLLPGVLFIALNWSTSYRFYHVNTYKLLILILGVSLLFLINSVIQFRKPDKFIPLYGYWKSLFIIALPLIGTIPGLLAYQGQFNYYLPIEVTSSLVLLMWAGILFKGARGTLDIKILLFFIALTVLYCFYWALLERSGRLPHDGTPTIRVKITHGNTNYFSGFMVVILPVLFAMGIPQYHSDKPFFKRLHLSIANIFYLIVFSIGMKTLGFAMSRAALVSLVVSLCLFLILYLLMQFKITQRKVWFHLGICLLIFGAIGVMVVLEQRDTILQRFSELSRLSEWEERLVPWKTAWASIQASPWLGYGPGSSYDLFYKFVSPDVRLHLDFRRYNHAHNEVLELMQEGGILALSSWLCMWIFLFRGLFKIIIHKHEDYFYRMLAIGMFCGFIAYLLHSNFTLASRMIVVKLPVYTFMGLSLFLIYQKQSASQALLNSPLLDVQPQKLCGKFMVFDFFPHVVLFIISWRLFIPWVESYYGYVESYKVVTTSQEHINKLEKAMDKAPNLYGLQTLAKLKQIKIGRKAKFRT